MKIFLNLKCKNEYDHLKKFLIKLKLIMLSIEWKILKLCKFFGNFQIITTDLDNKYIWNWIDIESLKLDKFLDEELDVMVPNTVYTKQI